MVRLVKAVLISLVLISVAQARIGETVEECNSRYGKDYENTRYKEYLGFSAHVYQLESMSVVCCFLKDSINGRDLLVPRPDLDPRTSFKYPKPKGTCLIIIYYAHEYNDFSNDDIDFLLLSNGGDMKSIKSYVNHEGYSFEESGHHCGDIIGIYKKKYKSFKVEAVKDMGLIRDIISNHEKIKSTQKLSGM
jgi:hypothetical protein